MKTLRKVIIFTFLAVLLVTYYVHISSKTANDVEALPDNSFVGTLLALDPDISYPDTVYDVVSYYSDIIKAYYSEDMSDDQLVGLVQHARTLFDDELLSYNPYETFLQNVKAEITVYKAAGKKITDYSIQRNSDVTYIYDGIDQYARINVLYWMMEGNSDRTKTYERYTLRKDDEGHWKILYWELVEPNNFKSE